MMQRIGIFCGMMMMIVVQGFAQSPPPSEKQLDSLYRAQLSPHVRVYANAMELRDYQSAITALLYILQDDPENQPLIDTLANLYFQTGNFIPCARLCDQQLERKPENLFLQEVSANVLVNLGDYPRAIERFSYLFDKTSRKYYRYQLAALQFQLGRYGESGTHIEAMLQDPEIAQEEIFIDWGDGSKVVTMEAALLNLRGNLLLEMGKENDAKKSWRAAWKLDKEFELPRRNLNQLQAEEWDERMENDR